jgi:small subunit ribosomal protein S2
MAAKKELKEKIEKDIEKGGVSKNVAEKEEKLAEEIEEAGEKLENEVVKDIQKKGKVSKKAAEKEEALAEKEEEKFDAKKAEKESTDVKTISDIEEKKRKLMEKAKKLAADVEINTEELKEQVKGEKKTDMLVPLEDYINAGIYIGTKVVTPDMRPFVYRRRADGLAIFNTDLIDEKLKNGIKYLSQFQPNEIILVCKRQAGWRAAEKFSEITGIRVFTKKYPAGVLTNSRLTDFFENELTIVCDSWVDKNALKDTKMVGKKVLMVCDTNNFSKGADEIIIGNNKSAKSLGIIFYLLAKGYCEAHDLETYKDLPGIDWWIGNDQGSSEQEAKRKARAGARFGV